MGRGRTFPARWGETALCVLALLDAGLEPDEEHIQRALAQTQLADRDLPTTYARSLQTMVFCRADPVRYSQQIHANYLWLQQNQIADGPRKGAWSYPGGNGDNSNSQFALLALYEAQRAFDAMHDSMHAGVQIDPAVWRLRQGLLERLSKLRRLLGLLQGRGRHGQHDLRGNRLDGHCQRHGQPARRQRQGRSGPVLRTRRRGQRRDRAGNRLAGAKLQRLQQSRAPRASCGCSITSTAWNASGG